MRLLASGLLGANVGICVILSLSYWLAVGLSCPLDRSNGCITIQASSLASLFGVPISALGLGFYVLLAATHVLSFSKHRANLRKFVVALATFGACFSLVLLMAGRLFVGASCSWCLLQTMLVATLSIVLPFSHKSASRMTGSTVLSAATSIAVLSLVVYSGFFRALRPPPAHDRTALAALPYVRLTGTSLPHNSAISSPTIVVFTNGACSSCSATVPSLIADLGSRGLLTYVRAAPYDGSDRALRAALDLRVRQGLEKHEALEAIRSDFEVFARLHARELPFVVWWSDNQSEAISLLEAKMRLIRFSRTNRRRLAQ